MRMKLTVVSTLATVATLAALLAAAILLPARPAAATEAMGKSTALACTACHDKPGSKLLTAKGKYFETMGSLEGYEALEVAFKDCTSLPRHQARLARSSPPRARSSPRWSRT